MGFLSSSVSFTRYLVPKKLEEPFMETVEKALKANAIKEIDGGEDMKSVGFASFELPFEPGAVGHSFVIANYLVFALRIDKKSLPSKVVRQHFIRESAKRLAASGREFLTKDEKKQAKEHVENVLSLRIPPTPSIHDIVWDYEAGVLYFMSTSKAAKDELETLFYKAFGQALIPLFPYTLAERAAGLSKTELDRLENLAPQPFTE